MTKEYSQMKHEFIEFYHNEVKDKLPEYNKQRKEGAPKIIAFYTAFLSVITVVVICCLFPDYGLFVFPLPFICVGWLIYLTKNDTPNPDGSTTIKSNYEEDLKSVLMKKFVKIFFPDGKWAKSFSHSEDTYTMEDFKARAAVSERIRQSHIINPFPVIWYDDRISGTFRDVKISICEANTHIFNSTTLLLIPFTVVFLSLMTTGMFLIVALIALIVFIGKVLQYAPFRGVIVEFDMNKSFKGHTFFHENSFTAKKIQFNHKKYQKVNLESVTFGHKYNVYADNQIEARYLLTPAFMERIENLSFAFMAKYVRVSFRDNKLTLAIHTNRDMFAMGNDFKDTNSHTFETLYDEMISILQIVDELKLNEYTRL